MWDGIFVLQLGKLIFFNSCLERYSGLGSRFRSIRDFGSGFWNPVVSTKCKRSDSKLPFDKKLQSRSRTRIACYYRPDQPLLSHSDAKLLIQTARPIE